MKRVDKLAVARRAIEKLPKFIERLGTYSPATSRCPALWQLDTGEWHLSLAKGVLLSPDDPGLSCLLDVWPSGLRGGKVFSVSWIPEQPWLPPRVVRYKSGPWEALLEDSQGQASV